MRICTLLVTVLAFSHASAEEEPRFKATDLGDGLTMLEGEGGFVGGNLGLSVGEDGVVLIDNALQRFGDKMLSAVIGVSDQPIDYVINTHVHGDHIGNNKLLAERGAEIVAHRQLRGRMVEKGIRSQDGYTPAPAAALPTITFSDEISFYLNGETVEIFHVASAHTDGDAVIHFRGADVIHTGDVLFNGTFPFIDLESGGSVDGFIAALKAIHARAGQATRIIPGHGPLASREDLKASIDMLEGARAAVMARIEAGDSADQAVAADPLAAYEAWASGFIDKERMVRQLYADLSSN